ncbi:RING-H2 finger protein ATL57-like [Tasmannia lanceolata]|uniref:RING-H2 finger protein ATL57-like n=1 Tax=Tasmannia lanceolata TaxID=3420 RepID=UPI004063AD3B
MGKKILSQPSENMPLPPTPSPGGPQYSWNPILIALVGSICIIFLFLCYYKIFGTHCFHFNGPPFSRDPRQGRLLNEANTDDSLQFQSRGLDFTILRALPVIQYKNTNAKTGYQSESDCSVCLGEFGEGEWLRLLPSCAHVFHISCIDTWFQTHSSCPLCRSNVIHNFTHHDYSLSMFTLLETLRREETYGERFVGYQVLGSETDQNPVIWQGPTHEDRLEPEFEEPVVSVVSSPEIVNDHQNVGSLHKHDYSLVEGSSSRNLIP